MNKISLEKVVVKQYWSSENKEHICDSENIKRDSVTQLLDPVHSHKDGKYWWYDEVWADEYGPFDNYKEANDSVIKYAKECLG